MFILKTAIITIIFTTSLLAISPTGPSMGGEFKKDVGASSGPPVPFDPKLFDGVFDSIDNLDNDAPIDVPPTIGFVPSVDGDD